MSSEGVVQQLLEFVANNGKIPGPDEPGLEQLIQESVKIFGSLENALRVAGLISETSQPTPQPRRKKESSKTTKQTARPKNILQSYPKEYFLRLLKLRRHKSKYPAPEGTPKWWERKAGKNYICSSCSKSIQKTERYIGRKTLSPGRKGIYGYRGTYHTHYFHIICLLREARKDAKKGIESLGLEIESLERGIVGLRNEISTKTSEIRTYERTREQKKEDYRRSSVFGKIGKWLQCKYSVRTINREIRRLQKRIDQIGNQLIPYGRRNMERKSTEKSELQRYLGAIEADIRRLEYSKE